MSSSNRDLSPGTSFRRGAEKPVAETIFFSVSASVLLLIALVASRMRGSVYFDRDRLAYAFAHLPGALTFAALFCVLIALVTWTLPRFQGVQRRSNAICMFAVFLLFCLFWLPVLIHGGFVHDDWLLLAAASTRRVIMAHPLQALRALDTVDGNYRPLGTAVYMSVMLRLFGLSPFAFLSGNFLAGLASALAAFCIVRELGHSRVAATASAFLVLSRGVSYVANGWLSGLGDGLAILFCAVATLAILRAWRSSRPSACMLYFVAWLCLLLAMLSKQSAFAAAAFLPFLFLLRPGITAPPPLTHRALSAVIAFAVTFSTALAIFTYGRHLLNGHAPYALALDRNSIKAFFSYIAFYIAPIQVPPGRGWSGCIVPVAGFILAAVCFGLAWRFPVMLGKGRREGTFLLLATMASIALLLPLGGRITPYYGDMPAYWFSLFLGIAFTQFGSPVVGNRKGRIASFLFFLLLAAGLLDVRLKQVGLTSPGYIWGTFDSSNEQLRYRRMEELLKSAPSANTLVLVDFPFYASYSSSMALLADPHLERIFVYDTRLKTFFVNSRHGLRPADGIEALNDPMAYNWLIAESTDVVKDALQRSNPIWLGLDRGLVVLIPDSNEQSFR